MSRPLHLPAGGRIAAGVLIACSLAGGLVSCSNSNSPKAKLEQATQQVRNAAYDGTYNDIKQAVSQLENLTQQEAAQGDISAQDAQRILDRAQALLAAAMPKQKAPSTPTVTTPSSQPPSSSAPASNSLPGSASSSSSSGSSGSSSASSSSSQSNSSSASNSSSSSNSGGVLRGLKKHPPGD